MEFQVRGFRGSGFLERGLGIRGFAVLGVVFRVFEFRIGFGVSSFRVSGSGFWVWCVEVRVFRFGVSRFGVSGYGWRGGVFEVRGWGFILGLGGEGFRFRGYGFVVSQL